MSFQQSCMKTKLSNEGAYRAFEKLGIMKCKCSSCSRGDTMGNFLQKAYKNAMKQQMRKFASDVYNGHTKET